MRSENKNGMAPRLVLASASPRRLELCRQLGLECDVRPVDIDETPAAGEQALDFVQRMAREKTMASVERREGDPNMPVLGSDTVVDLGGEIFGKPTDETHAVRMLSRLSGSRHEVHTAVALHHRGELELAVSTSVIEFDTMSQDQIQRYIATGEPMDKAGAYAIQGIAARYIIRMEGSYSGVMGLPLYETSHLLAGIGIEL